MKRSFFKLLTVIGTALLIASCSPDPYNLYPQSLKVEKIVMGESALEYHPPREGTPEYLLYEGVPYQDGGIMYQPFYLIDVEITPELGAAILTRKSRYGQIFGLLSKGAVGEASSGRLVPRVGLGELTIAERDLIDRENRDRELLVEAFMRGKQVPAVDHMAVRRLFAFARYQLMQPGIWVEKKPGEWLVKGGREYRERVMSRDPVYLPPAVEAVVLEERRPQPKESAPATRIRTRGEQSEPGEVIEPEPAIRESTSEETPIMEAPAPRVR